MLPLNAPIIGSHEPSDIAAHQLFLAESDFHNVAQELIDNRNLIDGYLLSFTPILRNYTLSVLKTFYSTGDDWWQIGVVRIEKNEDLQSSLRRITNDKSRLAKLDISRCVSIILGNRDAFKDPVSDDGSLLPKLDKEQLECLRKIRNSAEHSVDGFPDEYTENKLYELQEIVGHFDETLAKKIYDKYCELRRKSIIPDYYIPQTKNTLSIFLGINETSMFFRDEDEIKRIDIDGVKTVPSCVLINDTLDLEVGGIASDLQCVYPENRFIKIFHRKFILSDGLVVDGQLFTPRFLITRFFKELLLAFSKTKPNVTDKNVIITVPMDYKELELDIIRESAINSGINEKQLTVQTMDKLVSFDPELAEQLYFIINLDNQEQSILLKKGLFTVEYLRKTISEDICSHLFSTTVNKICQISQISEGDITADADFTVRLRIDAIDLKERLYRGGCTRGTCVFSGKRLVYSLDEADLESASAHYISSLLSGIDYCLSETGIPLSKIFKIVATGCESKNPLVKSALRNKFNKIDFDESSNSILDALSDSEQKP